MAINPDDLRALADFLDTAPKLCEELYVSPSVYTWSKESWSTLIFELGTFEKSGYGSTLQATRKFGDISVQVMVSKEQTCEKRITGFKTVTKEVYPEHVKPVLELAEEPIVEWVCPPSWKNQD